MEQTQSHIKSAMYVMQYKTRVKRKRDAHHERADFPLFDGHPVV